MNYIQPPMQYIPQNQPQSYPASMYNQTIPQQHVQIMQNQSPKKATEPYNAVNIDLLIEELFKPTYDKLVPSYKGYSGDEIYYQDFNVIIEANEELGGLYLGNLAAAQDLQFLKENNISAVLTVAKGSGLVYLDEAKIQFHELIEVEDAENQDLEKYFEQGCEFIERNRKLTSVFVHCFAGVSRSASIIIAYLMKKYLLSFIDAFNYVRERRSQIYPNNGFVQQLRSYEKKLKAQQAKNPQLQKAIHGNLANIGNQQNLPQNIQYQFLNMQGQQAPIVNYQPLNQNQFYLKQQQAQQQQQQSSPVQPELQSVQSQIIPGKNIHYANPPNAGNLRNSIEPQQQQQQQQGGYYVTKAYL